MLSLVWRFYRHILRILHLLVSSDVVRSLWSPLSPNTKESSSKNAQFCLLVGVRVRMKFYPNRYGIIAGFISHQINKRCNLKKR